MGREYELKMRLFFLVFAFVGSLLITFGTPLGFSEDLSHQRIDQKVEPALVLRGPHHWYVGPILSFATVALLVLLDFALVTFKEGRSGLPQSGPKLVERLLFDATSGKKVGAGQKTVRALGIFSAFMVPNFGLFFLTGAGPGEAMVAEGAELNVQGVYGTVFGVAALFGALLIWSDNLLIVSCQKPDYESPAFEARRVKMRLNVLDKENEYAFWQNRMMITIFVAIPVVFSWNACFYSHKTYGFVNNQAVWGMAVAAWGSIGMLVGVGGMLANNMKRMKNAILDLDDSAQSQADDQTENALGAAARDDCVSPKAKTGQASPVSTSGRTT